MKHSAFCTKSQRGFSLIEMAMMIIVLGLLTVAGSAFYNTQQEVTRAQNNVEILQTAQNSLQTYLERTGHLPCPASRTAAPDTANFGTEFGVNLAAGDRCMDVPDSNPDVRDITIAASGRSIKIGTLPVRALGLPDKYMTDAWGSRLTYVVTSDMATQGETWGDKQGAIEIRDARSNESVTATVGNVVFTLLSAGKDKRGTFNFDGTPNALTCGPGIANENCNDDEIFVNTSEKSLNINGGGAGSSDAFTYSMNYFVNGVPNAPASTSPTGHYWKEDPFGDCLDTSGVVQQCGAGTKTRNVECRDPMDRKVADSECLSISAKPVTTVACAPTCHWQEDPYGICNVECGEGQKTRNVTCISDDTSGVIADSYCIANVSPKPPVAESCEVGCEGYVWYRGPWEGCPDQCGGGGSKTRSVYCRRESDGVKVGDAYCLGTKPSDRESCPSQPVPEGGCCTGPDCCQTTEHRKVDVYFLADNTGSMGPAIADVKSKASDILSRMSGDDPRFEGVDIHFAVGSYYGDPVEGLVPICKEKIVQVDAVEEDGTPSYYEECVCASPSCLCINSPPEEPVPGEGCRTSTVPGIPYYLKTPMTSNASLARQGINNWRANGGGDWPEGQFSAMKALSTEPATGWRPDAGHVLVWMGDAFGHEVGTSREDAANALKNNHTKVIALKLDTAAAYGHPGLSIDYDGQANRIIDITGGAIIDITNSSAADLADLIVNQVGAIVEEICPITNGICKTYAGAHTAQPADDTASGCLTGIYDDVPDTSSNFQWKCKGNDSSSTADDATCSANKPSGEDGVCDTSVRNGCSAGTANDGAHADTDTHFRWRCDGIGSGGNSGMCERAKECLPGPT